MTDIPVSDASLPTSHADNGILGRVPSEFVAQAGNSLPNAATAPDDEMCVEVNAAWLGLVRLTFTKHRYRRPKGRFSSVFWSCCHAEAVAHSAMDVSKGPEASPELDVGSAVPR